ncbi:hypothetical protein HBI56_063090 [Parastagonospora nodorum]|nr:hypothetical protein HBH51_225890 [Parastagonospora nodorum]KAH3965966.1 hypothetical protein HBH52_201040 [Parastagonospora nodorum]KAH4002552.1 hypothetical protein HBI10_075960 [Parastagonospora nodorum]KAH4025941.1 hypothetical protein HBI13_071770 [Parastagonospora nodorum]KAH4050213.1 hypothetical protein HBH49_129640 [Parastagonospora nodorum]
MHCSNILFSIFLLVATCFAAPSAPNAEPYHIQSFAEIIEGIADPMQASDCQAGTFYCDTNTAESYHVVTWVLALIGMALLALLFISYCVAVFQILWHRNGCTAIMHRAIPSSLFGRGKYSQVRTAGMT